MKYFSMFSGIGGFEYGIEQAKKEWKCVGYSEINKYAIATYQKHYPKHKNYGDATKINPRKLPDFAMLCGGFPCQAFSIAGKRRGFTDTRGTLFFDIARIVKVKRPKIVWLENVKGLLNHNKGETFRTIIQKLSELGYDVQWMVLNSKFFGVPQNRERVFIIGSLRGEPRPEILPFGKSNKENKEMVYAQKSDREVARVYDPSGISPTLHLKTGGWQETKILAIDCYNKKVHPDRTPTLTEPHHNTLRLKDGERIRKLTPIEYERLQGFPDNWTIGTDTQRYNQCGNAVTTNVIKAIAKKLL